MAKFHINANGDAKPCKATVKACKFGDSDHFDNPFSARAAAEQRMYESHESTATPLRKIRNALGKAFSAVEEFTESVEAAHKRDMDEIGRLAHRRQNKSTYK